MDIANFLIENKELAPIIIFILILLGGANIPISIDIVMIATAFIAANFFPEKAFFFFMVFLIACLISAWIAYSLGRFVGRRLITGTWMRKLISEAKLEKAENFYKKFGFWAFIIGRFIPFGVRNCLFMSSGIARMPFYRFVLFDAVACTLWAAPFYYLLLRLGQNIDVLQNHLKVINLTLFVAFSVTVITFICYKVIKRKRSAN